MKIGINGQILFIDEIEKTGPVTYLKNLLLAISKIDRKNSYKIYTTKSVNENSFNDFTSKFPTNFEFIRLPKSISWMQFSLAKELLIKPVDIFFTSTHSIPFIHSPKLKIVSMIHGLEYKTNKQYINSPLKGVIHPLILAMVLKFSTKIVTPSIATKDSILKSFNVQKNKIEVIPEGVSSEFYKRAIKDVSAIKHKYGIGEYVYLLFVSTIQPRKNLPKTIEAFSNFIKNNAKYANTKLVVAGKNGWQYEESLKAPQKYSVSKNVIFTGPVPNEDLPILFSGAHAFVSCSLEEGFGLPLLEALSCNIPAMVSDIPAFREIGGNKVSYVNPDDIRSIESGFLMILTKPLKENLSELARKYSWEKTAKKTLHCMTS